MAIFRKVVTFKALLTSTFLLGLVECLTLYYPSYRPAQRLLQQYPEIDNDYDYIPKPSPSCAKLTNQYGKELTLGINQELVGLEIYSFIPVSIEIWDRCVLFLVDSIGNMNVYYSSTVLQGELCWPITYAHCESCLGKLPRPSSDPNATCAILYDAPLCSTMLGFATEAIDGDEEPWLGVQLWRKISSIVVREECELEIYDSDNFQGRGAIVTGTVDLLSPEWDDQIVSFKCKCTSAPTGITELPTIPTTSPPVTLSTTTIASSTSTLSTTTTTIASSTSTRPTLPTTTPTPSTTTTTTTQSPETTTSTQSPATTSSVPNTTIAPDITTTTELSSTPESTSPSSSTTELKDYVY